MLGKKTSTKLWNASKFSFLHLEKFSPKVGDQKNLESADKWILNELYETIKTVEKHFEEYEYSKAEFFL